MQPLADSERAVLQFLKMRLEPGLVFSVPVWMVSPAPSQFRGMSGGELVAKITEAIEAIDGMAPLVAGEHFFFEVLSQYPERKVAYRWGQRRCTRMLHPNGVMWVSSPVPWSPMSVSLRKVPLGITVHWSGVASFDHHGNASLGPFP